MIEILIELAKISPVIAVLVVAIIYFIRKENKNNKVNEELRSEISTLNKESRELNKEIRETEKENLKVFIKLTNAIESLSVNTDNMSKEMVELKHFIELKIQEIKNNKNN